MPLPNLNVPMYPNIPQVLGVPPILRNPDFPPDPTPPRSTADGPLVSRDQQSQKWGIYEQSGAPAVIPDAIIAVDFANDFRISDYPLEAGAFESYNKVANPYDARVVMTCAGREMPVSEFLAAVEKTLAGLTLYNLVTPEKTYGNANVVHYDYDRQAHKGATMLTVECWLREVRVTATVQFTSTKEAAGASPQATGTVQPVSLTADQAAVSSGIQ